MTMRMCPVCTCLFNLRSDAVYCSDKCGQKVRGKKRYDAFKERILQSHKTHRTNHFEKAMIQRRRSDAKKRGIVFTITEADIVIPEVCPALGIPIIPNFGVRGHHANSPSIDRINPKLGYVSGNVHVISHRANQIKNDTTVDELQKLLAYMESISNG